MQQLSLVQKPKETPKPQVNEEQIVKTITSDCKSMWNKIQTWLENCKQQKENFAYFAIEYRADVHLDGSKEEHLSTTTTMERPFRDESGDSYGGSWGCGGNFSKNNLDELKKDLIEWRKSFLEVPYCKEKADGTALRDIKAENVRIFINDKGKDFIARTAKWTLNDLTTELKSIKEKPLTEDYLKKFDRMNFLNKEIHRIEYEVIPELKKKVESFFKETEQATLENKPDLNQVAEIMRKNKCNLKQMQEEYDGLRHEMYRWG